MRTNWIRAGIARVGLMALLAGVAGAQTARDLGGTWQGTLPVAKDHRLVLKITRQGADWTGVLYDLDSDRASEGRATTQMSLAGPELRFAITPVSVAFEGKLSGDGASMTGTWT